MPPNIFTGTQTGAVLLQAAQSLIAVNNQRKQLELEREKAEANLALERQSIELRERNAATQEKFAQAQLKFAELRSEAFPLQQAQAQATLEQTQARTASLLAGGDESKPPSPTQFMAGAKALKSNVSAQILQRRASDLGVEIQAGDTVESIRAELIKLSNVTDQLLERNLAELDPSTQADVQRRQQRRQSLQTLLEDESLQRAVSNVETGQGVPPEVWRRALQETMRGQSLTPADQDAIVGGLLQRGAEAEAAQASRGLFGGLDDGRVRAAVDSAVAGDPMVLSALVRRHVLPSVSGGELNRTVATELLRLGYDQDTIRGVIRSLATQLSSQ